MELLQNIKELLSRYFPLHLNSTVEALEDDLADSQFARSCALTFVSLLKEEAALRDEEIADLRGLNNAFRRDNTYLNGNLEQARQHIRVVQQELDDVYKSMTPQLSRWPMPASAQLDDSGLYGSVIRVELPPLRLACMVNEAVRKGLYKGYVDAFSEQLAATAYKEVKSAVADILNNALPIK